MLWKTNSYFELLYFHALLWILFSENSLNVISVGELFCKTIFHSFFANKNDKFVEWTHLFYCFMLMYFSEFCGIWGWKELCRFLLKLFLVNSITEINSKTETNHSQQFYMQLTLDLFKHLSTNRTNIQLSSSPEKPFIVQQPTPLKSRK